MTNQMVHILPIKKTTPITTNMLKLILSKMTKWSFQPLFKLGIFLLDLPVKKTNFSSSNSHHNQVENCHLIHLLNFMNGHHLAQEYSCHHGIHQLQLSEPNNKLQYKKLRYPTYVNDTNLNVHMKISKRQLEQTMKSWKPTSLTCLVSP